MKRSRATPGISATAREQRAEIAAAARAAVGIDGLAEELDLHAAALDGGAHFGEHVVERTRHLAAARRRHDAERAVLVAAFDDRHPRLRRRGAVDVDVVVVAVFGELDARCASPFSSTSSRWPTLPGPITKSTHGARSRIRSPSCCATQPQTPIFDARARASCSRSRPRREIDLLLRLVADRAGVEQDQVRLRSRLSTRRTRGASDCPTAARCRARSSGSPRFR